MDHGVSRRAFFPQAEAQPPQTISLMVVSSFGRPGRYRRRRLPVLREESRCLPLGLAFNIAQPFTSCRVNKFYLDEVYVAFIVRPLQGFAWLLRVLDQLPPSTGLSISSPRSRRLSATCSEPIQNGLVQFFTRLLMALGLGGLSCCRFS